MKALVVLAVLLFGFWLWRSGRRSVADDDRPAAAPKPPARGSAVEMIECAHCGVHCAQPDTVDGRRGRYCSAEHRRLAEG